MIDTDELKTLIPQSEKMFLLSRVTDYSMEEGTLQAEFDITENCIFHDKSLGGVPAWIGLEFIAQSISALSGIRGRAAGNMPKIGFLLSVSNLKIYIPVFKNGSTVKIKINQIDLTDIIYTFEGEIYLEDEIAIEGRIMVTEIFEKDERYIEFAKKLNIKGF